MVFVMQNLKEQNKHLVNALIENIQHRRDELQKS